jgi:putative addiction module component (TIGR02574 family)
MSRAVADIEREILALTEEQRARLAASILDSLPGVLVDQDDGVAEAQRRDAELDEHPERALSIDQLDEAIRNRAR